MKKILITLPNELYKYLQNKSSSVEEYIRIAWIKPLEDRYTKDLYDEEMKKNEEKIEARKSGVYKNVEIKVGVPEDKPKEVQEPDNSPIEEPLEENTKDDTPQDETSPETPENEEIQEEDPEDGDIDPEPEIITENIKPEKEEKDKGKKNKTFD